MRAELRDALSALADGEVADPALVAEALRDPDAAILMVTLAETRLTLRDTSSELSQIVSGRVHGALATEGGRRLVMVKRFSPALFAGLGLTAGVLVGVLLAPAAQPSSPAIVAPASAREAVVTTTAAPAPLVRSPALSSPQVPLRKLVPPRATSRYRFEVGRNWREGR